MGGWVGGGYLCFVRTCIPKPYNFVFVRVFLFSSAGFSGWGIGGLIGNRLVG